MTIPDSSSSSSSDIFDYIIVGAGSAGCLLANRLPSRSLHQVCCCSKQAARDNYLWIHVPVGLAYIHNNPRVDWCYESEPEPHLDNRRIRMPRGKTLGGSSSINGMVYVRGHGSDYDQWRQMGNTGWGWDDVLPYFRKLEDHYGGASDHAWRGRRASRCRLPRQGAGKFSTPIAMPPQQSGPPRLPDYNGGGGREGTALVRDSPSTRACAGRRRRAFSTRQESPPTSRSPRRRQASRILFEGSKRGRRRLHRERRAAQGAPRRRSHPDAPAPSVRRNCCRSRALAPAHCCARTASTCSRAARASAKICRTTAMMRVATSRQQHKDIQPGGRYAVAQGRWPGCATSLTRRGPLSGASVADDGVL